MSRFLERRAHILFVLALLLIASVFFVLATYDQNDIKQKTDIESPAIDTDNIIYVEGSDTILPVTTAEAEAFEKLHPDIDIEVIGGGSGAGIAAFIDKEVDIVMASRKMKEAEIQSAMENGIEPLRHVIAWDGITVVVNNKNPVEKLSFGQLKEIYTGNITNWREVGGNDVAIVVVSRQSSSGTYEYFKSAVLEGEDYYKNASFEPNTNAVNTKVSENEGSIGYIGYAYCNENVKPIAIGIKDERIYPTDETIQSGRYPLSRPLQYYTDGEPKGNCKLFVEFVKSASGKAIIKEVGYLPAEG